MRFTYIILAACLFLLSCKKTELQSNPSSEYFPNSVGNYWRYKCIDSIANTSQMVDIKIIGSTILPGGQNATIWTYTFTNHIDTNYVYQIGNAVRFADRGLTIRNTYVLPLQLNSKWRTSPDFLYDSIIITDNRGYNLNNKVFENSFSLHESGYLPNNQWNRVEWFCPNIGIITKTEKSLYTIANQQTSVYWELVEYNLK